MGVGGSPCPCSYAARMLREQPERHRQRRRHLEQRDPLYRVRAAQRSMADALVCHRRSTLEGRHHADRVPLHKPTRTSRTGIVFLRVKILRPGAGTLHFRRYDRAAAVIRLAFRAGWLPDRRFRSQQACWRQTRRSGLAPPGCGALRQSVPPAGEPDRAGRRR